jgi:hypothetical protein
MRTHALAAILCLQWVLWTTPVHGTALAATAIPEAPAVASHCAAPAPAADPEPRGGDGACMLHCTTFAQAAVSAAPSLSAGGLQLLPPPGAAFAVLPRASISATLPTRPPGPPARERLLRNSVLRL